MHDSERKTDTAERLQVLRQAHPTDATLQNLLVVLGAKLDLCARLPVYEYEALSEAHDNCAAAFHDVASVERQACKDLVECLRRHLNERDGASHRGPQ
ncbi:MAG TPA: hypothetical protein VES79_08805 [Solirubrobacteraceae bacterium]|nr:hypothetical protein [Solirubrobacteraceae bacterium]